MLPFLLVGGALATILVAWKTLKPGAAQLTGVATPANAYATTPQVQPNPTPTAVLADTGLVAAGASLSVASSGLGAASSIGSAGGASWAAGSAIPIAGAAVAAVGVIFGVMMQAHAKRLKQATDENSAVNLGVKGFDADVANIAAAVNSKQISAGQAITLLAQVKTNYWAETVPHIQPGRNGCNGGQSCPGGQVGKRSDAGGGGGCVTGQCKCAGSIGAACCVGCNCINGGISNLIALYQSGKSGGANICHVFGSKYGGADRAGYTVNYTA